MEGVFSVMKPILNTFILGQIKDRKRNSLIRKIFMVFSSCSKVIYHLFSIRSSKNSELFMMKGIKNDIFISSNGCLYENIELGRSFFQINNIDISNCFFSRMTIFNEDGGVILVSVESYSILVSLSMFYKCKCQKIGGAIFFKAANAVLSMICANMCSALSEDHFALFQATNVNQMEYLSISSCSDSPNGIYPIRLYNGNQIIDKSNSSMNIAEERASIGISLPSSFSSSFCTFSDNYASKFISLYFHTNTGVLSFANIIHNNSPAKYSVVRVNGKFTVHYCVLQRNLDTLFSVYSGTIAVSHCLISHSEFKPTGINNSLTICQTYQIEFFNSQLCNADIPLFRKSFDITIAKTPSQSPINTIGTTPSQSPINTMGTTPSISPLNIFTHEIYVTMQCKIYVPFSLHFGLIIQWF